jgi:hypothetical protein
VFASGVSGAMGAMGDREGRPYIGIVICNTPISGALFFYAEKLLY